MPATHRLCLTCLLALLPLGAAAQPSHLPRLREFDVLKLVEKLPSDATIVHRIRAGVVDFEVDDGVLSRLKGAGASAVVLAALRQAAKEPPTQPALKGVEQEDYKASKPNHGAIEIRVPNLKGYKTGPTVANKDRVWVDRNLRVFNATGKWAVFYGWKDSKPSELPEGAYTLGYEYARKKDYLAIKIERGRKTIVNLGCVVVQGDRSALHDSYSIYVGGKAVRPFLEASRADLLLPGKYYVHLNGVRKPVTVTPGGVVDLRTGNLLVRGDFWKLRPIGGEWQVSAAGNTAAMLLPGKYEWKAAYPTLSNGHGIVEISAGKTTIRKVSRKK